MFNNTMDEVNMFLNIIYNKTCFLCFQTGSNMMNVAEVLEIRDPCSTKVLKLSDIVIYLFPSFDITCSQACRGCSDLLIKMYVGLAKNNLVKNLVNTLTKEFNKYTIETNEKELIVNLTPKIQLTKKNNLKSNEKQIDILHNRSIEQPQSTTHKVFPQIKQSIKHKKKYYNCNDCAYRSLCKGTLEGHINKYHIKTRPFVCQADYCYKSFYSKSNLTEHSQIHSKVREICEVCGDEFGRRQSLVDHLRLHTNDRQYKCEICDKYFVNSGRRLDHMKRNHLEKKECCMFCDKRFGMKKELIRHVKSVHT